VVVGNGTGVPSVPHGVKVVKLPENLGVAGGRNAGVQPCTGDVVLLLDDDGWFPDRQRGSYVARSCAADPGLAVATYLEAGGLPEAFFYAHEETDLAWRRLGLGTGWSTTPQFRWAITRCRTPGTPRSAAACLLSWFTLTVVRERSAAAVRAWGTGFRPGGGWIPLAVADVGAHRVADDPGRPPPVF
jgi:Glycosyl transferase family 2